ncbi:MAG: UDP-N-acetylmuramate dehydrogenase [Fibromonadaceae bacterium]|jgi:UDP-N-acetylmuramate dehydrogenase|nr:UDP-N-acetylmuramate dehydrogenase [Fibromonadaceae bacterium]
MFAITGLIGSGKSLVSSFIREAGFEVLDADALAHTLYSENAELRKKITEAFGTEALTESGINRPYISQIVFSDPQKLQLLESLVYPILQNEIEKIKPPFIEAAVLHKIPELAKKMEEIWVIEANETARRERISQRGLSTIEINNIMRTQTYCSGKPLRETTIQNNETPNDLKIKITQLLKKHIPKVIEKNISLKKHCSFKIGGNANFFAEPKNEEELCSLLAWRKKFKIPYFVLGHGSNVLFSDEGYGGLVIKLGKWGAGKSLHSLIQEAANQGLGGIEKLQGIPGTIGGAIYMNAGAHKQEISDCIKTVSSITPNGEIITRTKEQCEFSYRSSIFKGMGEIIVSAEFDFVPMQKESIDKNRKEVLTWRKEKQPLQYPNAGSVFKNPISQSAGALIEACGLKGHRIGDAELSELHANFIVNKGNATAKDVKTLMEKIVMEVEKKHGVVLEPEIMVF